MNRKDFLTNKPDEAFDKQAEAVSKPFQKTWVKGSNETISIMESLAEGNDIHVVDSMAAQAGPQRAQATPGIALRTMMDQAASGPTDEMLNSLDLDYNDEYERIRAELRVRQARIRQENMTQAAEERWARRSDNLAAMNEYQTTSTAEPTPPPLQYDGPSENVITRMYRRLMG